MLEFSYFPNIPSQPTKEQFCVPFEQFYDQFVPFFPWNICDIWGIMWLLHSCFFSLSGVDQGGLGKYKKRREIKKNSVFWVFPISNHLLLNITTLYHAVQNALFLIIICLLVCNLIVHFTFHLINHHCRNSHLCETDILWFYTGFPKWAWNTCTFRCQSPIPNFSKISFKLVDWWTTRVRLCEASFFT